MHVLSTDAELLYVLSSPYVQVCSLPLLSRAEVKCIVGCLSRLTRVMSNAYLIKMAAKYIFGYLFQPIIIIIISGG